MSMIAMLVILGMIIAKASDPATWAWLVNDQEAAEQAAGDGADERGDAAPAAALPAAALPAAAPVTAHAAETVLPGPTDQDIEESDGAAEEFLALTDGALELSKEEMPAYWRLFRWTMHQSSQQLKERAQRDPVLNQFIRDPDEQRGKLFRFQLNVRRVLAYDAPPNKAGVKKVYEIWGFTTESQAWLYCVVTPELPAGMPVGASVHEQATFTGYFLKLQGYYAAGAGPRDRPLQAPLLVGRVAWKPSPEAAGPRSDFDWVARQMQQPHSWVARGIFIGGLLVIVALGYWIYQFWQPRRRPVADDLDSTRKVADVRNWLSDTGSDSASDDQALRRNSANGRPGRQPDLHSN
jgi:hypothetical protein